MKTLVRHIVADILLASVLTASVGIPVIHHFCMGTSAGTTVFLKQRCCEGSEDMPKDCCHDDVVLQQLNDDGILAPSHVSFSLPMVLLLRAAAIVPIVDGAYVAAAVVDTSPPSHVTIPIVNQSLLI